MAVDILLVFDPVDARAVMSRHPEVDWTSVSVLTVATAGALDGLIVRNAVVTAKARLAHAYSHARDTIRRSQAKTPNGGLFLELAVGG